MKRLIAVLILLSSTGIAFADSHLILPKLFSSNMVLQRDRFIPVWGRAEPGSEIQITFAGTSSTAIAKSDGHWKTYFPPLPAGGPYEMRITAEDTAMTYTNVMMGDVWVASGQSNMQWRVDNSNNAEQEIADANYANIRLFTVPRVVSGIPKWDVNSGTWDECSPETVPSFSAVAYYFGRELHRKLDVPIGLLHTSWGGTVAEAWTSAEMLNSIPDFKHAAEYLLTERPDYELLRQAQQPLDSLYNYLVYEANEGKEAGVHKRRFKDADWKMMMVPGWWEQDSLPGYDGSVWYRKTVELAGTEKGKELEVHLGKIRHHDIVYFNGTEIGRNQGDQIFRKYVVPANLVRKGGNVLAVRITNRYGNGGFVGPADSMYISLPGSTTPIVVLSGEWKYDESTERPLPRRIGYHNRPAALFNAMIAPLIPYGIRGAIWYQGESNAGRACQYRELFPKMIEDWRVRWGQGYFPFLFVQLANYTAVLDEPGESNWAELREAQLMTLDYPNTGQAVTIDIGEADDIHPRNKQDVGVRLALAARKIAYGQDIVYSGPIYESMQIKENEIHLTFDHIGNGLEARGDQLLGFAIAGKDRNFVWADAKIVGDKVVVSSPRVPEPVAVRYGWANNPVCNLFNKQGLPASPFRTDDFPGITCPE